jgi:hypothetical protein
MWSLEQIIGGAIAVIVAGMPAMIALLKIRELHILVNGRLSQWMEATVKAAHLAGQLEGRDEGRKAAEIESATIMQGTTDLAKEQLAEAAEKARVLLAEAAEKARVLLAEAANEAQKKQKES